MTDGSRASLTAIALMSLIGAIAACSRSEPRARAVSHAVSITNFTFAPAELTVARGDTVTWTNADFVPHTATGRDTRWDSGAIGANATWRFVAETPGRHEYYCVYHPNMTGTIVVR